MSRITLLVSFMICLSLAGFSQDNGPSLYDPELDAAADIAAAITEASETGKHVFLQVGGNWCGWCIKFHNYVHADAALDSIRGSHYVVRHVNYSRENTNDTILAQLDFPQRFGFPVFVILDGEGNRIHTQNSALLESGNGYDRKKIEEFFKNWTPEALDPRRYERK